MHTWIVHDRGGAVGSYDSKVLWLESIRWDDHSCGSWIMPRQPFTLPSGMHHWCARACLHFNRWRYYSSQNQLGNQRICPIKSKWMALVLHSGTRDSRLHRGYHNRKGPPHRPPHAVLIQIQLKHLSWNLIGRKHKILLIPSSLSLKIFRTVHFDSSIVHGIEPR